MIELRSLTKHYEETVVVDRLSLTVNRGELLVLLGGSGAGKTTILKMINRLIEPDAGTVFVDGADVVTLVPHDLRRRIGYVFQQIGLFPHLTVAANVGITPALLGWERIDTCRRVDELLELVGLDAETVRERFPNELSGGQQQRVGVARALAANPSILLLDEPFGALDPLTRQRLQDSLLQIRRALELTVVFVTHDMVEALLLGDRIAVLDEGHLVQLGTPHELLTAPASPYVRDLMGTPREQARAVDALLTGEPS